MIGLLESDYPRDIIERQINERLKQRLFKMWWETGDVDYFRALNLMRVRHDPDWSNPFIKVGQFFSQLV